MTLSSPQSAQHCIYCGLPVPKLLGREDSQEPSYCCTGCRFAHAITSESGAEGENRWTLTKLGISIFFSMNVMVLTLALWAYDGTDSGDLQMAETLSDLFRFTCLLLSFPVIVLLGQPLFEQASYLLRQRRLSADLLIVCGVAASFLYSMISVWRGSGSIYFEVGCMILVFVTLGRWLEATGKLRSTEALDQLQKLLPEEVVVEDPEGNRHKVSRENLQLGDQVVVRSGERIPVDGKILRGWTSIDEQLLTGESWPVEKSASDDVVGGTLVLDNEITIEVTTLPDSTILERLVAAVREARMELGAYQQLADRISQYFVPATFLISLTAFAFHAFTNSVLTGLMAGLAVVLIACPCGLGLATPMALWAAMGVAVQRGIVFSSTRALEKLSYIKAIRFDKTGTLTTGTPILLSAITDGDTEEEEISRRAYFLARSSNHIFSEAILSTLPIPENSLDMRVNNHSGKGLYGTVEGEFQPTILGNLALVKDLGLDCSSRLLLASKQALSIGQPCVFVGWGGVVRAVYLFNEQFRTSAPAMIEECKKRGFDVGILTGDSSQSAGLLGEKVGIPVLSGLTPMQKQEEIKRVQQVIGPVALVGDGINDAVALSTADVGISLGCGADVSRDASEVCLVSDDLSQIPWLLDLSRETINTIRTNLTWSFTYNGIGMLVAASGMLHPALAALLMVASSLFVISNSLRLRARFSSNSETIGFSQSESHREQFIPVPEQDVDLLPKLGVG